MTEQFSLFEPSDTPSGRAIAGGGSGLPKLVVEMIEVMGVAETMALVHEMRGLYLLVPGWPLKRRSSRFDALEKIVGTEAAQKYAERWGNIEIQVPKCDAAMRLVRDRDIVTRYEAHEPVQDICRRYDITERHFWRLVKKGV